MLFWIREVAGWLLVGLSLFLISLAVAFVSSTQAIEAGIFMFAALSVMRLGILLIRVSTAARICLKEEAPRQP